MPTLNVNVTINSPALTQILQNTEKLLMSAADDKQALADLQAAEADNSAKLTTLQATVTDGIAKLEALIASNPGGVAAADIQAVVAKMKADSAAADAINTQITTEEAKQGV